MGLTIESMRHGAVELERGLAHQLPHGVRQQRGPGARLVPEEFKKIGVEYAYFRHAPENNWYPHYVHNLDNLVRFGGLSRRSKSTPTSAAPCCWARRGYTRVA